MKNLNMASLVNFALHVFAPIMAAVLLFVGLSTFGMWEPLETAQVQIGEQAIALNDLSTVSTKHGSGLLIGQKLSALGLRIAGRSELSARLPQASLAFAAVLLVFFTLRRLAGINIAAIGTLVLASAPVLLFNGRQVTGGAPILFGETMAFCGVALLMMGKGRSTAIPGAVLAVLGIVLTTACSGLLWGVVVPTGALIITLALTGDILAIFSTSGTSTLRRRTLILISLPLFFLAIGTFFYVVLSDTKDTAWITGRLASVSIKNLSATTILEQLVHGWFPWSALLPVAFIGFLDSSNTKDKLHELNLLALSAIIVGIVTQTFYTSFHGPAPIFLAFPMSFSVALALTKMESSKQPLLLGGIMGIVLLAIMLRDYTQRPDMILAGFGVNKIKVPEDFQPVKHVMLAIIPFALMIILAGFVSADIPGRFGWRRLRVKLLMPLAAACFGGYIIFFLVPGLSVDLSSRHVIDSYRKFAPDNEPITVLGKNNLPLETTDVGSTKDIIEWLEKSDRAFALIPPRSFGKFDREYRKKTGEHIFVADGTSDKFLLVTNKKIANVKNQNPIAEFVFSEPFEIKSKNEKNINFDNKVTLLGWDIQSEKGANHLKVGQDFTVTTYWRCDEKMSKDYKFFMHIDGSGTRIHGDHDPVKDVFPTRDWSVGDYIKDVYLGSVPRFQETGKYNINIGLYKGASRLKILDNPAAKDNSIRIGKVSIK